MSKEGSRSPEWRDGVPWCSEGECDSWYDGPVGCDEHAGICITEWRAVVDREKMQRLLLDEIRETLGHPPPHDMPSLVRAVVEHRDRLVKGLRLVATCKPARTLKHDHVVGYYQGIARAHLPEEDGNG